MTDASEEKLFGATAAIPAWAFPGLIAGNVILAFGPWLVRIADTGPVAAGFWRMTLSLPVLVLIALWRRQGVGHLSRGGWWLILLSGLFFAADLGSWHFGIMRTKLANATLFGNVSSLLLPLWAAIVMRHRPRAIQAVALALAFSGALLMMGNSYELAPQNLTGDLSCLLAGVFYTVYLLGMQKVRQSLGSWSLLALSTAASVIPLLLFALALGERIMPHDWTPLLILGLSAQVIGQGMMIYALAYFTPLVVGLALLVQPAVAALVGWLAFGETLTLTDAVGALAVAIALVLVRLPERRPATIEIAAR